MATKPKLILVDGSAVFYRGYHAIPHLSNAKGEPTNAIYGFTSMLLKVLGDLKPTYAIVAWDKSGHTFRNDLYDQYKAHRVKAPDDLYQQMPRAREVTEALGIPFVELDNYEADDIIGTLAAKAGKLETVIVTGDLDELQLVSPNVKVYTMRRGISDTVIYDLAAVKERYGVTPEQFIDVKALKGDASDNIPGVKGIGEKTAVDLISRFGSLDDVYKHLDEIGGKTQKLLENDKKMAYLSQELSRIVCDVKVDLDLEKATLGRHDRAAISALFRELDFKSLLTKLPPELSDKPNLFDDRTPAKPIERTHLKSAKYHCIDSQAKLDDLAKRLTKVDAFAFDTETDSLDVLAANLVGMSFSFKAGEAYYVPVGHAKDAGKQLDKTVVLKALKPILESPKVKKIGHNIKFDYQIMKGAGVTLAPIAFDTMVASFLVNPLARSRTLDDLAYSELGIEMIPIEEMIGARGKNQTTFDHVPIHEATTYAAEDADITWRLYQQLEPQLKKMKLVKLADQTEWPLIPILAEMELAGIELDQKFLAKFNKAISAKILELEEKIWKLAGQRFNIASPAQLGQILFEKLGIDSGGIKRGKTGLSTAAAELEKMRDVHPIIELLLEYRELIKLKSTYVDALPKMISPVDGRIHTSFSQTIAQTGRLSSNNPNLQNIPVRTELGREIRKAFVAPKGRVLISADYSQFELRIAAALSGDEAMIKALRDGVDVHVQTAAELYDVPIERVTKEQRDAAKTINFGVLYGMSPHGLSVATGMSREEAVGFIERYYELRPKLKAYIEKIKAETHKREYAETLFGRRRPLGEINSNNFVVAAAAERMAVNVPIQGTQADIMKLAMIELAPKLDAETKLLLQIHDELIVEAPKAKAEAVTRVMKETLEKAYDLGVPIEVDTSIGVNWGEL